MAIPAIDHPKQGVGKFTLMSDEQFPLLNQKNNNAHEQFSKGTDVDLQNMTQSKGPKFSQTLRASLTNQGEMLPSIPIRDVHFVDRIPMIRWTEAEFPKMDVIENLNYSIVGKFSYGWPSL
ncbi:hypothetical protein HAX54_020858 [Datura stramonium]|uniref:Uncharacterized protein n=1 Tax=Datura stramonium TaxID=4076 RepID=A0ABS8UTU9_DATST|nr:hypothetical protein [Datura stramonium]